MRLNQLSEDVFRDTIQALGLTITSIIQHPENDYVIYQVDCPAVGNRVVRYRNCTIELQLNLAPILPENVKATLRGIKSRYPKSPLRIKTVEGKQFVHALLTSNSETDVLLDTVATMQALYSKYKNKLTDI